MPVFKDMDLPPLFLWMIHHDGGNKIYPTSPVFCPSPSPFPTTHNIYNNHRIGHVSFHHLSLSSTIPTEETGGS